MSKQMSFTLACAAVLAVLVPGSAGYLSARFEAVEAAERDVREAEIRLRSQLSYENVPVALPTPCELPPLPPPLPVERLQSAAMSQEESVDHESVAREPVARESRHERGQRRQREAREQRPEPPPEWFAESVTPVEGSGAD